MTLLQYLEREIPLPYDASEATLRVRELVVGTIASGGKVREVLTEVVLLAELYDRAIVNYIRGEE